MDRRTFVTGVAATAAASGPPSAHAAPASTNALHFTMFNFRADLPPAERDRVLGVIRGLADMKEVKHLAVGPAIHTRPNPKAFTWISIVGFDNDPDHDVYMVSPPRSAMGKQFMPSQSAWIGGDYEEPGLAKLWSTPGPKYRHCVMFDFKPDVPQSQRMRIVAALRGLERLPMVKAFTVSKNNQKPSPNTSVEWLILADFADAAGYKAFQATPEFKALIIDDFAPKSMNVQVGDLQVTPGVTGR